MTSGQHDIVALNADLLPEAAQLRRQVWGGSLEANSAYLRWKYLENPYLTEPLLFVALSRGAALGMRGFYGTSWVDLDSGERFVLPAASDLAILKEHRNRGIFEALNAIALDAARRAGYSHVINLSANPDNALASIVGLGWRATTRFRPVSVTRNGASGKLASALSRFRARFAGTTLRHNVFRHLDRALAATTGDAAVSVDRTPPIELIAATDPQGDNISALTPTLDRAFLEWRYRNPLSDYRFLSCLASDPGYVVLTSTPGTTKVFILDWGGCPRAVERLLKSSVELTTAEHIEAWSNVRPAYSAALLLQAGFVETPSAGARPHASPSLLVRTTQETNHASWHLGRHDLRDPTAWSLRAVASDAF